MSRTRRYLVALTDPAIALGLGAAYVVLLLSTTKDLGYARDEGFYFQAARSYGAWIDLLLTSPSEALTRQAVDRYWAANNEHPALIKTLFALSHRYLFEKWQWFADAGTAFRFPGMVFSGIAIAVIYAWGARVLGRLPGVVGAVLFATMPRIFYHAHLDCFDLPVAAMWLLTSYAFWRSLNSSLGWAILTGVLYGLLLNTKHNSWLLPPALVMWFLVVRGSSLWRNFRTGRLSIPTSLITMATLGPIVFYALWPWIWHDTGKRLAAYVAFHMHHDYYNMEFLGRTYWKPPMPLGYAWLMTAATVPLITLLGFVVGLSDSVRHALVTRYRTTSERILRRFGRALPEREATSAADRARFGTELLWLLCILTSYAPWFSKGTPIFGGTKHWITAYPFMCLFAARAFLMVWDLAVRGAPSWKPALRRNALGVALAVSVIAGPAAMTLTSHPWGLSAYTPLVGGASGAATMGLNRTFWGYTTGAMAPFLNEQAPKGARVYVHDTAMQSWDQMVADGMLREDLRGVWHIEASSFALYHHEPHMQRVEYQVWTTYGTVAPAHVGTHHGVPVGWIYRR